MGLAAIVVLDREGEGWRLDGPEGILHLDDQRRWGDVHLLCAAGAWRWPITEYLNTSSLSFISIKIYVVSLKKQNNVMWERERERDNNNEKKVGEKSKEQMK